MNRTFQKLFAVALVGYAVSLGTVSTQTKPLRICGDPDNLPYSNEKLEGFENKVAAVIAAGLGTTPEYAWWAHQRGLVRNTIEVGKCDVIFGVPEGLETVLETKPYYRSSYVIAYRKDSKFQITSFDAPELKKLRLGTFTNSPVEESLARRGLAGELSRYSTFFDPLGDRDRPDVMLKDLISGKIDVAFPWGPLAGYYVTKLNAPLTLVPLKDEAGVPLNFGVGMGVAHSNRALKTQLEAAIDQQQGKIRAILDEYGVPQAPATQAPAPAPATATTPAPAGQDAVPAPAANGGDHTKNPFTDNADAIALGKVVYGKFGCQACHGGAGGGGMAMSLIDENWKFGSDDATLYKLIKGQIPEQTMPTVFSKLSDDEVWQVLAFVRSLYKGDPAAINWK